MIGSTRRLVGAALAMVAAVAAVWSAFIGWYAGRKGSDIRLNDLFNQITQTKANTFTSLFIPLGVSALLALAGVLVSRWLWVLGGLIALATTFLWGLRQAQTFTGLHASLMGNGPALAAGSGALMLIAAAVATGRRARSRPTAPAHAAGYDRETAYARPAEDRVAEPAAYNRAADRVPDRVADGRTATDRVVSDRTGDNRAADNRTAAPAAAAPAADEWAESGHAYQQGYDHGQGQAAEQGQTLDETLGQKRDG